MTTLGYLLPDPSVENRFTIFFTGGILEEASSHSDAKKFKVSRSPPTEGWRRIFANPHGRTMSQKINVLAANVLLGAQVSDEMNIDGSLEYSFKQPIGGHGKSYVDVSFLVLIFCPTNVCISQAVSNSCHNQTCTR